MPSMSKKTSTSLQALKSAVEFYFSEEYLFEPENAYLRDCVSPSLEKDDIANSEETSAATPAISCASLLNLTEIQNALRALEKEGTSTSNTAAGLHERESAQSALIAKAVADSKVVTVVLDSPAEGGSRDNTSAIPRIRRTHALDASRDPCHRTVVARPLPLHATHADLAEFFYKCGGGGKVEKIKALQAKTSATAVAGGGIGGSLHSPPVSAAVRSRTTAAEWSRRVNPFLCAYAIRFESIDGAKRAVQHFEVERHAPSAKRAKKEANDDSDNKDDDDDDDDDNEESSHAPSLTERFPHFGSTEVKLAQKFFPPRLYVSPLAEYECTQRLKRKEADEKQLKQNVLRVQTLLAQMREHQPDTPQDNTADDIRHYLRKGVTLIADAVPAGVQWHEVKKALGELGAENERAKGAVQLAQIVDIDDNKNNKDNKKKEEAVDAEERGSSSRRAFIVCRSSESAGELLAVFSLCEGKQREMVRRCVPALRAATAEEEAFAQRQFASWFAPKGKRKMQSNQRRQRSY